MYYALVDMRGDCCATTALAWGDLKQVADMLISECENKIYNTCSLFGITINQLEEDYYCEFDGYRALTECESPTEDMIRGFSFVFSDFTIDVGCLAEGYAALVKAFGEYTEDKMTLDEWKLAPEIEETEEVLSRLDSEMRSLNDDLSFEDYEFFVAKADDGY